MSRDTYSGDKDSAEDGPLFVIARIRMLTPEEGGKEGRIGRLYRPNHNFGDPQNRHFYIGQVELDFDEFLHPGESKELLVSFFNDRGLRKLVRPGAKWRIQEADKLVAWAEVIDVIEQR